MKELKVENSDKLALVDNEHFERLSKFKWFLRGLGNGSICRSYIKYAYKTSHIALANEIKQDYKSMFDHADRDPFNNQDYNLRVATQSQNIANVGKRKGVSSIFKGISWSNTHSKWRARVVKDGEEHNLGYFDDEIEAAVSRDKVAKELHGEFTILNTVAIVNRLTSGMLPLYCKV